MVMQHLPVAPLFWVWSIGVDRLYAMRHHLGVNNNSGRERGRDVVCWNCDQVGHYSKNCPQPKRERRAGN